MGLDMMLYKEKKSYNEVAYWRKANAIHKYLCDNGICIKEDIEYIIPTNVLKDLLEKCEYVKKIAILKDGEIEDGRTLKDGEWVPIMVKGKYIENAEEIEDILPTQSGFFFGSLNYDEYYMRKIDETITQLKPIIEEMEADENEDYEIRYYASW